MIYPSSAVDEETHRLSLSEDVLDQITAVLAASHASFYEHELRWIIDQALRLAAGDDYGRLRELLDAHGERPWDEGVEP